MVTSNSRRSDASPTLPNGGQPDGGSPSELAERSALIFSEVGYLASTIQRLGVLLVDAPEDPRDTDCFQHAIKALSVQAGLLCDIGAKLNGGTTWNGADPEKWLLPPIYPGN